MRRAGERGSAAARKRSLRVRGRVCSGLFFFPRGGSAQVARALAGSLPETGWQMTLATGSLGKPGDPTHAGSFYSGIDIAALPPPLAGFPSSVTADSFPRHAAVPC